MREEKVTLFELFGGIIGFSILVAIVGGILAPDKLRFLFGVLLGSVAALGLCYHMYKTLEKTLDMGEDGAKKHAYAMSGIRMVIMGIVVFVAIWFSDMFSVIGVMCGILTLKFAAFAQPLVHKNITTKLIGKGR